MMIIAKKRGRKVLKISSKRRVMPRMEAKPIRETSAVACLEPAAA
jgi:hypothetical protein